MFLGENLLPYLVLAMGAALAVGNLLALLVPRESSTVVTSADDDDELTGHAGESGGDLERPPVGRSLLMILVGTLAALWAIASLMN